MKKSHTNNIFYTLGWDHSFISYANFPEKLIFLTP